MFYITGGQARGAGTCPPFLALPRPRPALPGPEWGRGGRSGRARRGPPAPASPPLLTPLTGFFPKNFCGGEQKRPGDPRLVSGRCESQPGEAGISREPRVVTTALPHRQGGQGPDSWRLGWRLEHRSDPGKASPKCGLHLARGGCSRAALQTRSCRCARGVHSPAASLTGSLHLQTAKGERETVLVASASWLFVLAPGKDQNNS